MNSTHQYNFVYECTLTAQDFIHFASLEVERRVAIEPVIHNYALSYAIFLRDSLPVTIKGKKEIVKPNYKKDLNNLNAKGIYVTPAFELSARIVSYTWGAKEERLLHKEAQVTVNYPPSMVTYEAIAPNSTFKFFILSTDKLNIPEIIRLGKKRSPARITAREFKLTKITPSSPYHVKLINPWDLVKDAKIEELSSIINIPPNRLFMDVILSSPQAYYSKDLKMLFPEFKYYAREGQ